MMSRAVIALLAAVAATATASPDTDRLSAALGQVPFFGATGVARPDVRTEWVPELVMYTEQDNVTRARYSWAAVGVHSYLYQVNPEAPPVQ